MTSHPRRTYAILLWFGVLVGCLSTSLPLSADVVFQEDFEASQGDWQIDNGVWQVGTPTQGTPHSGQTCVKTNLSGSYPDYTDSLLISPTTTLPIAAPGEEIQLRFWQCFSYNSYGQGYVYIRERLSDGGWSGWVTLRAPISGSGWVWSPVQQDLTPYAGKTVQIAFYHYNQYDYNAAGWMIDDVSIVSSLGSLVQAKGLGDGETVGIGSDAVVTAAFSGCFYVESTDRSCGLRVEKAGYSASIGSKVFLSGIMRTATSGERYLEADWASLSGTGTIRPFGLSNRYIGGMDWCYDPTTGAGQCGVLGGLGLNNIGLLIKTWGKVTQIGSGYLYIDDGSGLRDETQTDAEGNMGVRVICSPTGYSSGDKVEITGISSCFQTSSGIVRRILTRGAGDIRKIAGQ